MTPPPDYPTGANGRALLSLYPQLKRLTDIPAFVEAISDDYWVASSSPWLHMPDLVAGEDVLWDDFAKAVPELAKFGPPGGSPEEADIYRCRTRRAAVRTIALACGLGTATFAPHAAHGGEANIMLIPIPGLECRIGRISSISWRPSPIVVTQAAAAMAVVEVVETALLPFVGNEETYRVNFSHWKALEPLRVWDQTHRFPLIAQRAGLPSVPGCYVPRYTASDLAPAGVPMAVAAEIAAPYAASVVREVRQRVQTVLPSTDELLLWALDHCGAN
jgi:hypothetical protein